ncbi:MAG TPA: phosphoribosylformylglycinamidine synthase subunit PurQ [Gammaproteobacteria bacterium]|nr:phosphoribosylformylglycinamidine synthase subunit PurQ [Gammaproteobacteria bacterium]
MRIALIQFPGSTHSEECVDAIKRAGLEPISYTWTQDTQPLHTFDGFLLSDGYSFGAYPRRGIRAALTPLMKQLKEQSDLGKPILGIGDGACILVEAGLVPGLEDNKPGVALITQRLADSCSIKNRLRLSNPYQRNAFTRYLSTDAVLSFSNAETIGQFVMTHVLSQEIKVQGLGIFTYYDEKIGNIAALANKNGNVLAMFTPLSPPDSDLIFRSIADYIQKGYRSNESIPLSYYPRPALLPLYRSADDIFPQLIPSPPSDPVLTAVGAILQDQGLVADVKRYTYEESRQPFPPSEATPLPPSGLCLLVKPKFSISQLSASDPCVIQEDVLWYFNSGCISMETLKSNLLSMNILFNPYTHDCYEYKG